MSKVRRFKKLRKFIKDPDLFFYDMFKKRVFKAAEKTVREKKEISLPSTAVDLDRVRTIGVQEYLRETMGAGYGVEDGSDKNSLLIWSGNLYGLLDVVSLLKESLSMSVTLYTLGGHYNSVFGVDDRLDVRVVGGELGTRPDFVLEMGNEAGVLHVLRIYQYDIADDGLANVRSSSALIRKFQVRELGAIYNGTPAGCGYSTPIDAVYTWVNHADSDWQALWTTTYPSDEFDPDRYTSNDELRYSLRSLNKYAPWLNRIYVVSNCSQPGWMKEHPKIVWVKHEEIFPAESMLPTFNSHAIEACLHRIPGLSENFLYLNDDFVLNQPCLPKDFFDEIGRSVAYFEPYGMVDSKAGRDTSLDYLAAANNSKVLLKTLFSDYEARCLHRHVPYALKKTVLKEIEEAFAKTIESTRNAKRRSLSDVNVTSFLYHHFAFVSGRAVKGEATSLIVRPGNVEKILGKDTYKYKMLCFNDGDGSATNGRYKEHTSRFFTRRLSESAAWEQ
jgi:hypothetical protein